MLCTALQAASARGHDKRDVKPPPTPKQLLRQMKKQAAKERLQFCISTSCTVVYDMTLCAFTIILNHDHAF